jgi:cytochrome b subunit of formate dehydrogenase
VRSPRLAPLAFAALAAAVLALPVGAQVDCSDCHDVEVPDVSAHAPFGCTDCHTEIEDYPHPEQITLGAAVCGQCHDAADELEASIHAGLADCASCHGGSPHAVLPIGSSDSAAAVRNQPATCGECHDEALIGAFVESVHGHALLESGLTVAPSCAGCHGAHDILPPDDPRSRVSFEQTPETCGRCHEFVLDDWTTGAHGMVWARRVADGAGEAGEAAALPAPVCSTCHSSHQIGRAAERAQRLESVEVCGDCHGGRFVTYRDSFHGQATSLGFVVAATCADCHGNHVNLPPSNPASSVHPDNLAATCGQCHGDVSAAFLTFEPHADPADPEESHPGVYWIYVFMTGLLIAVFAFFSLHTVLWLQRAIVGWMRGELEHAHDPGGPWVKRFSRFHRGTHLLIIVSFLTLAATGLPLKFHFTDWAQALASLPFFIEIAHVLHRIAAVITFGYALAHLGFIVKRSILDKKGGLLYGWRSMVPRPKDLFDLLGNLRWFLYLGPRPKFDRWTYWEKFDYFAVFWGIPIIGFSGLMLWFPELFTALLPGWALNAAWVVHSDEALLATGFIFIFHFFHTHLRPEAFPMDPVMFVGAMPLERFKDERPDEYRRLVERGELESLLVAAPPAYKLHRARIFGFAAVAVGLALAVGIIVGVFF